MFAVRSRCTFFLIVSTILFGCANMDRKVEQVSVKSRLNEPIDKLALVFLSPQISATDDPKLVQGYNLSGALIKAKVERTGERSAQFFELNGVKSSFAGNISALSDVKAFSAQWVKEGFFPMVFIPVGVTTISQSGAAIGATVRYRIIVFNKTFAPVIEFYDNVQMNAFNSNSIDSAAAGWLNALTENGLTSKQGNKLLQPPYRDFVKEEREKRNSK